MQYIKIIQKKRWKYLKQIKKEMPVGKNRYWNGALDREQYSAGVWRED